MYCVSIHFYSFLLSSMAVSSPFPMVLLYSSSFSYIQSSSFATGEYIYLHFHHTRTCTCMLYFLLSFNFYLFCAVSYAVHSSLMLIWVPVLLP